MAGNKLIFQLGTNNWQRGGEFAPGSGILHEAHHKALNAMPGITAYSMYPSKVQRQNSEHVRIFALDHDIPICESLSPVSSKRWHSMSDDEISAYRSRLADEVFGWMDEIERSAGETFSLAIAHHTFLNPLVMRDVIARRMADGKPRLALICFVHGTALKMYENERRGDNTAEYPMRFLPMMEREKVFSDPASAPGIDMFAAISSQQKQALTSIFPAIPARKVVLSPNGYNHGAFKVIADPGSVYENRKQVLTGFTTAPCPGSSDAPRAVRGEFDGVVAFCGKFADWKRLEALLYAARGYEQSQKRIATLIVGTGSDDAIARMHQLAYDELKLRDVYFLGPRAQDELAIIFNTADVGCFPSYKEPFGLVFIECMACGTPVIGARSGGPRDFVSDAVGALVSETDDLESLGAALCSTITTALAENWKASKGPAAARFALENFSVANQVANLLSDLEKISSAGAAQNVS